MCEGLAHDVRRLKIRYGKCEKGMNHRLIEIINT